MAVKDLQPRQGKVELTLDIIEKEEPREFEKFGKSGKVCNCIGKDETGQVKVTLWNEQTDQVNKGDKVKISNGWVSEYQGELQVSTGKFGSLEIVGKAEVSDEPKEDKKPDAPEETVEDQPDISEEDIVM